MLLRCVLILPLFLAACGGGPQLVGKDTVDPSYTLGGGIFESGDPVIIAAAVRNFSGQQAICAIRVNEKVGSKHKRSLGKVLQPARIEVNGETVLQDLRELPLTRSGKDISGSQANCYVSGESWTDGQKDIAIVIPPYRDRSSNQEQIEFNARPVTISIEPVPSTEPLPEPEPKPGQWQRSSS